MFILYITLLALFFVFGIAIGSGLAPAIIRHEYRHPSFLRAYFKTHKLSHIMFVYAICEDSEYFQYNTKKYHIVYIDDMNNKFLSTGTVFRHNTPTHAAEYIGADLGLNLSEKDLVYSADKNNIYITLK